MDKDKRTLNREIRSYSSLFSKPGQEGIIDLVRYPGQLLATSDKMGNYIRAQLWLWVALYS